MSLASRPTIRLIGVVCTLWLGADASADVPETPPSPHIVSTPGGGWTVAPTGTAADSEHIQWAMDHTSDGGTVHLLEGDYLLGGTVHAVNFFGTLKGAGETTTILHMGPSFQGFRLFDFDYDDTGSAYDFSDPPVPVVVSDFTLKAEEIGLVDGLWFWVETSKSDVEAATFFGTFAVAYMDITVQNVSVLGRYDFQNPQWNRFQRNSIANGVVMESAGSTTISGRYANRDVTVHDAIAPVGIGWNLYDLDAEFVRVETRNQPLIDAFDPDGTFNPDFELRWLGAGISVFFVSDSRVSIEHCSTTNASIVALGMEDGGSLDIRNNHVDITGFLPVTLHPTWITYSGIARGSLGPNPPDTVIHGNTVDVGPPSILISSWGPIDTSGISIWGSSHNTEITANELHGPDFGVGTSVMFAEGLLHRGNGGDGFPYSAYLGGSAYFGWTTGVTVLGNQAGVNASVIDLGVDNVVLHVDSLAGVMPQRVSGVQTGISARDAALVDELIGK